MMRMESRGNWRDAVKGSIARRASTITPGAVETAVNAADDAAAGVPFKRNLPGWQNAGVRTFGEDDSDLEDEEEDTPHHRPGFAHEVGSKSGDWKNIIAGSIVRRNSTLSMHHS